MIIGYLVVICATFLTTQKLCSGSLFLLLVDHKETFQRIVAEDRAGSLAWLCSRSLMVFICSTDKEEVVVSSIVIQVCWRGVGRGSWGSRLPLGFWVRWGTLFFWEGLVVGGCLHNFWVVFPKGFVFVLQAILQQVSHPQWTYLQTYFYIIKD